MDHKLFRKYELVSTLFSTIVPPFPIVRVYGVLPLTRNFNFTPSSLLAAREAFHLMSPLVFPWPRPKKGELLAANGSGGQLRVKYWHFRLGDRDSSSLKSSSELKAQSLTIGLGTRLDPSFNLHTAWQSKPVNLHQKQQ